MATISDVALKAGVSKSTVSNVFSKKRPIGRVVTERVLEAAQELGYRPNYWAHNQGRPKNRIIGLLMQNESPFTAFHLSLLSGLLRVCREYGYRLLVNTVPPAWTVEPNFIASGPSDGEIVLDPTVHDKRIEERIKHHIPMVIVGRPPVGCVGHLHSVDNDNIGAAQQVANYLLVLGHSRIAFINALKESTVAYAREAGYRMALTSHGLDIQDTLLYDPGGKSAYPFILKLLQQKDRPTAVMTDSDQEAADVYRAAHELGLSIPHDLSVFAFMDTGTISPNLKPALNSVNLNVEELGFEAGKLLIEQCEGRSGKIKQIAVSATLNLKDSCARPPTKEEY